MIKICIFCEGDTEKNYIQSLNRLLRSEGVFNIILTAKDLIGVSINNYFSKIKQSYKPHELKAFTHFYAWLDFDIFKRSNKNTEDIKFRINKISFNGKSVKLLFNYMNGEDFMILHFPKTQIIEWKKICEKEDHFKNPMSSKKYLDLFRSVLKDYKKGEIPDLTKKEFTICIKNIDNDTYPFSSDIKEILKIISKEI